MKFLTGGESAVGVQPTRVQAQLRASDQPATLPQPAQADPVQVRGQRSQSGWKRQVICMTNQKKTVKFRNTNVWDTRQLVTMALLSAIGALLAFIQIPLIPGASFLSYDPSFVPAMVCGFTYGPGAGVAVGCIGVVIYGLIMGNWVGALINVIMAVCYILPAALIYRRFHSFKGGCVGLIVSCVTMLIGAILANLTVGVWFWYGSTDVIIPLILPAIVPFNLIKAGLNSVLTLVIYKAVSNLMTPKKNQVKGR